MFLMLSACVYIFLTRKNKKILLGARPFMRAAPPPDFLIGRFL
jgi:hypothetical protein